MTFVEARNAIVAGLEEHIGCPVVVSEQIADVPDFPYCYYSVLSTRSTDHSFGLEEAKDGAKIRSEEVKATMSFTFCGQNRELEDGGYIFGEDEALDLSEKAHGFFLLDAHNISTDSGDIVISSVGTVSNRSGFVVEDTIRRYGFDIAFSYVRVDERRRPIVPIAKTGNPIGELTK